MFEVKIDGVAYKVRFKHIQPAPGQRGFTDCVIADPFGLDVGSDFAACSKQDNFNKNTGRKIALTRALRKTGFSKEERRRFWDAYFAARGGKKE